MVPEKATGKACVHLIRSARLGIQAPGSVKARLPATIVPEDMIVWVTFTSLRDVSSKSFKKKSEIIAVKPIGQGRALMHSAV